MKKCLENPVPDFVIDQTPDHIAKCWLYDETEESKKRIQSPELAL